VDFFIEIQGKYIGLQIKPAGNKAQLSQIFKEASLQKNTHQAFTEKFGGKVFYIYSIKVGNEKKIDNLEVIEEIKQEIQRLKTSQ